MNLNTYLTAEDTEATETLLGFSPRTLRTLRFIQPFFQAAAALLLFGGASTAAHAANRPNIIFFFTDDHGWADIGAQGIFEDVKTPHTDQLAASGVRFTSGYSTAPQCRPSRAGLMSGRYQNRFGLEDNRHNAFPWSEYTIAERLKDAGYVTGMSGKWHLHGNVDSLGMLPDGSPASPEVIKKGLDYNLGASDPGQVQHHGFMEHFSGTMNTYIASHSADGKALGEATAHNDPRYRLEAQAEWGANFIKRHAQGPKPFFLYLAFYAPHVPLDAPQKYLQRFPGKMPERRRLALAMISAVDDGVGLISKTLADQGVDENTLIFYMSDNGAPLKIHKLDEPGGGAGWDGSLNDPWIGEKGMLTEGGIRIPFIARWPAQLPAGKVDDRPVITLDAVATSLAAAGLPLDERIEGVNLQPFLNGSQSGDPHDALFWRWSGQYAIRSGNWKYLKAGQREYLFDLDSKAHEAKNLIDQHPERAKELRDKLAAWSEEQYEPGFDHPVGYAGDNYFDHYLDGKLASPPKAAAAASSAPKTSQLFKARDQNKDGFVTLEEFIGNPATRNVPALTQRFKAMDTNNDGRLTRQEME